GMSGDFITISGDTGSGKSSFFNNILCQAVLDGFPVYSWSGEMTPQQQTTRMLAAFSGINSLKIKAGKYIDDVNDFTSLENAIEKIIGKDVFLDFGHMNIQKLTSTIINKHRVEGIKVFLLDRLELFDLSVKRDEDQAKGVFTSRLRSLANELGVTIVMAAQLRKSFESRPRKIPEIVDIKGAGAIIQDSTKIFLLYRPELYGLPEFEDGFTSDGKGEIFIKKNSHGGLGKERVDFNKYQTTWGVNFHLAPTASSGATGLTKDGFLTDDAGENKSSLTGPKNSPDEGVPF
ncbi:MAG: DnaB-like helicase C-terminal domain-containing protein, partial [Desulfobacterales bacterium]